MMKSHHCACFWKLSLLSIYTKDSSSDGGGTAKFLQCMEDDLVSHSKSRILHILNYLWQNTDAEHYATTADILTYLDERGISCDRKTIPGDIQKLCDIGVDIEEERSRKIAIL